MHPSRLYTDSDATSPAVTVVLMVAITVILTALIAAVTLGGADSGTDRPYADFEFDYEPVVTNPDRPDVGYLRVSHLSGDAIDSERIYLRGSGYAGSKSSTIVAGSSASKIDHGKPGQRWQGTASGPESAVVAGDYATVAVTGDYDVTVVYEDPESGASAVLSSDEGPEN